MRNCGVRVLEPGAHEDDGLSRRARFVLVSQVSKIGAYCDEYNREFGGSESEALGHLAWDFNFRFIDILPPSSESSLADDLVAIAAEDDLSTTQREILVQARIGQGVFRANVIQLWGLGEVCALTGSRLSQALIASHVRAWKICGSVSERLDGANGILLCAHIDRLFDQHLLSFGDDGRVIFGPMLRENPEILSDMKSLGISSDASLNMERLEVTARVRFITFLSEHRSQLQ